MHIEAIEPKAVLKPDRPCAPWESHLAQLLPLLGHRNWIVVADAAYPAQANPSIETIFTNCNHTEVLRKVLNAIEASRHIRAAVYLDAELALVPESDAPGVTTIRNEMTELLTGKNQHALPHEEIIAKLDEAGRLFRILILKSTLTIPYTSVFLRLDCGYWSDDAEQRLRSVQMTESARTL